MDNSKCAVIVPVGTTVELECEAGLRALETAGYGVRRVPGFAAIDQGRSQMASDALAEGFEEIMWIDSDIAFNPADVDKLRAHNLPIVCGIYSKKGPREIACHVMPGTKEIQFGKGGGLLQILYAATGFLLTRRQVYVDIQVKTGLPVCNQKFKRTVVPYFLPIILPVPEGHWYLGEDYSFCVRARHCGYDIMADTTIRLQHIGKYKFGWEDAGGSLQRFDNYRFQVLS